MGSDTIDKSAYNEAQFKMARINECQRRINYVNQDLLNYYMELNGFGYSVKKSELKNLMMEVYGKMDDKNKGIIKKYIKTIDELLDVLPFRNIKTSTSINGTNKSTEINQKNFNLFCRLLEDIHMYTQEMLEKAGYSTFSIDGDDSDPYN